MLLKIAGVIAIIGAGLYLHNFIYWKIVIKKAKNEGFLRDDRRDNYER